MGIATMMTETPSFSYAVVQVGPAWKVVCARKAMGHFNDRDVAVGTACGLARAAEEEGHFAEVLIQSETGELLPVYFRQL